ncbi:MAG: hypothetical protein ACREV1_15870 [Gammaproteobacteria bacterium]
MEELTGRLGKFSLTLAMEKTRCIEFGRFARGNARRRGEKPQAFIFLGFTHYCAKSKQGYFKVKRRTSRKKLGASLRAFTVWARGARHKLRKGEMLRRTKARVQGHLNYYAITDNAARCNPLSTAQHASCTRGSTARASARHTPGRRSTRHSPGWAGRARVSAST